MLKTLFVAAAAVGVASAQTCYTLGSDGVTKTTVPCSTGNTGTSGTTGTSCYTMGADGVTKNYVPCSGQATTTSVPSTGTRCYTLGSDGVTKNYVPCNGETTVVVTEPEVEEPEVEEPVEVCNCDIDCAYQGDCCDDFSDECIVDDYDMEREDNCGDKMYSVAFDFATTESTHDYTCHDDSESAFPLGGWCMQISECTCTEYVWGDYTYFVKLSPNDKRMHNLDINFYMDPECEEMAASEHHSFAPRSDLDNCQEGLHTRYRVRQGEVCPTIGVLQDNPTEWGRLSSIDCAVGQEVGCKTSDLVHDHIECARHGLMAPCMLSDDVELGYSDVMDMRKNCPLTCDNHCADRFTGGTAPVTDRGTDRTTGRGTTTTTRTTGRGATTSTTTTRGGESAREEETTETDSRDTTSTDSSSRDTGTSSRDTSARGLLQDRGTTDRGTTDRGTTVITTNTGRDSDTKVDDITTTTTTTGRETTGRGSTEETTTGRETTTDRGTTTTDRGTTTTDRESTEETTAGRGTTDRGTTDSRTSSSRGRGTTQPPTEAPEPEWSACASTEPIMFADVDDYVSCGTFTIIGMECPGVRTYCDISGGQSSAICCKLPSPPGSCHNNCGVLNQARIIAPVGVEPTSSTRCYTLNNDGSKNYVACGSNVVTSTVTQPTTTTGTRCFTLNSDGEKNYVSCTSGAVPFTSDFSGTSNTDESASSAGDGSTSDMRKAIRDD